MIQKIYRYLRIYSPTKIVWYIFLEIRMLVYGLLFNSYSQNKEDLIVDNLLGNKSKGFYVDVGAYHPTRLNNTKHFYLRGWNGINVEPDPEKIKSFYKLRPKDTNLGVGVASKNGALKFFKFEPNTLSTFSQQSAKDYQEQGFKLANISKIEVYRLGGVLSKYAKGKTVDFLSVDTEGLDLEVLKSNNWKRVKPKVVCIEERGSAEKFLSRLGYKKVYQTPTNSIFVLKVPQ